MLHAASHDLFTTLATSFDWSSVSSFLDLCSGDVGQTALQLLSQNQNICNAAVLESPKSLKNACTFAPQLRLQFGEKNFNKLLYFTGDVNSENLPLGYDVYIIRNMRNLRIDYRHRLLKKVFSVLENNEKKSLLIVTSGEVDELKAALEQCQLHVWHIRQLGSPEQGFIIEARAVNRDKF